MARKYGHSSLLKGTVKMCVEIDLVAEYGENFRSVYSSGIWSVQTSSPGSFRCSGWRFVFK